MLFKERAGWTEEQIAKQAQKDLEHYKKYFSAAAAGHAQESDEAFLEEQTKLIRQTVEEATAWAEKIEARVKECDFTEGFTSWVQAEMAARKEYKEKFMVLRRRYRDREFDAKGFQALADEIKDELEVRTRAIESTKEAATEAAPEAEEAPVSAKDKEVAMQIFEEIMAADDEGIYSVSTEKIARDIAAGNIRKWQNARLTEKSQAKRPRIFF